MMKPSAIEPVPMPVSNVAPERRGAAFGSIIATFDTGIGTGSMVIGWIVQHYGYRSADGAAAALALRTVPTS